MSVLLSNTIIQNIKNILYSNSVTVNYYVENLLKENIYFNDELVEILNKYLESDENIYLKAIETIRAYQKKLQEIEDSIEDLNIFMAENKLKKHPEFNNAYEKCLVVIILLLGIIIAMIFF